MIYEQNIEEYLRQQIDEHGIVRFILQSPFPSLKALKDTIIIDFANQAGIAISSQRMPLNTDSITLSTQNIEQLIEQSNYLSWYTIWQCITNSLRLDFTLKITREYSQMTYQLPGHPITKYKEHTDIDILRISITELIIYLIFTFDNIELFFAINSNFRKAVKNDTIT